MDLQCRHELLMYSPGGMAVDTTHSSGIHRLFLNCHIQDRYV